jgi:hypothetical protein
MSNGTDGAKAPIADAPDVPPKHKWQPISTAPKDGTDILVAVYEYGKWRTCVARWDENFRGSGLYGEHGWMIPTYQGLAHEAVSPKPAKWTRLPTLPPAPE